MHDFSAEAFEAIVEHVKDTTKPHVITLRGRDGSTDTELLVLPNGLKVQPVELAPRPAHPDRYEGTATLTDLESFIAHVNRFKDPQSVIFADISADKPSLLAVLDYHEARTAPGTEPAEPVVGVPSAKPRFGIHRSRYAFPLSDEFTAWRRANGQKMSQGEFAAFLEDRNYDLRPVPDLTNPQSDADIDLKRLTDLVRGRWAGPETLMDLSRGLAVHESSKVINASNLASGEGTVVFETSHEATDSAGARIEVPNLFCIGVPIFQNGDPYRIVVRLRYRKDGGALKWFYELYQDRKVFKHALDEALEQVMDRTGLLLLRGAPEPTPDEPPRNFAKAG